MKYQELKGLCKTCLGCNRLELENFVGATQCKNYIDETKKESYGEQERIKL